MDKNKAGDSRSWPLPGRSGGKNMAASEGCDQTDTHRMGHDHSAISSNWTLPRTRPSIGEREYRLLQLNTKLLEAVESGEIDCISRLLKSGANPNATCQSSGVSACHLAALQDNESLSLLVQAGAERFPVDNLGRTSLHFAAWAGHTNHIAVLLDLPIDAINEETESELRNLSAAQQDMINLPCRAPTQPASLHKLRTHSIDHNCISTSNKLPRIEAGWSALHCACARAHLACVRLLLAAGADDSARDLADRAPIDLVGDAYYNQYEINIQNFIDTIKLLAARGERFNEAGMSGALVNTPLHTAVELQSKPAVMELLALGAPVVRLNTRGLTAMHICVEKRLAVHLQLLVNVEHDEDVAVVEAVDARGLTVLHACVRARWERGVRVALAAGADPAAQVNDGDAPIHSAAAMGETMILRIMLDVAAHAVDLQNNSGETALFLAVIHDHLDVVQLLINYEASYEIKQPTNMNILHVAARHSRVEILKFLLVAIGVNVNSLINAACGLDLYTPIIYAVENNNPTCVQLLLDKGAHINIRVPYKHEIIKQDINTTPLHIAATKNHFEEAKLLLDFSSDLINHANSIGLQPLHEACLNANKNMITLFLEKGADLSAEHETKTPIQMLMDHLPNPTAYLAETFDCFISSKGHKTRRVLVNYKVLLPNCSDGKQMKVIKALISTGNAHEQKTLLQHPLVESFIHLKWRSFLPLFLTTLVLYALFVLSFNIYVVSVFFYEDKNKLNISNISMTQEDLYPSKPVPYYFQTDMWKYMIYVTITLIVIQEIIFFKLRNRKHFLILETWVKLFAIGFAVFLPSVVTWRRPETIVESPHSPEWVRLIATVAVLLSWTEMMFLLARFPSCGHYALMLGNVTTKVFKVLLTFGALIIGFSLCFLIQFRATPPFEGLWAAFTKTLVMMTSEFDYTTIINKANALEIEASIILLRVIFITFVIFASVVLMNIMIGIAVNDVNYLEKIGTQKRLQKQVGFLISLEDMLSHVIGNNVPKGVERAVGYFKKRVKTEIELNPGNVACKYSNILPKHIREGIYERAQRHAKHAEGELNETSYSDKLEKIQRTLGDQAETLQQVCTELSSMKEIISKSHSKYY